MNNTDSPTPSSSFKIQTEKDMNEFEEIFNGELELKSLDAANEINAKTQQLEEFEKQGGKRALENKIIQAEAKIAEYKKDIDYWKAAYPPPRQPNIEKQISDLESSIAANEKLIHDSNDTILKMNKLSKEIEEEKYRLEKEKKMISLLREQMKNKNSAQNRYNIRQSMINSENTILSGGNGVSNDKLFDLRSLPGGINFRGANTSFNFNNGTSFNLNISPSRSFYLNDYKFADSLTLNRDINDESNQKVQPIILNEFQPYDMLTPADLLDGIGDAVINVANMTVGMLAKPVIRTAGYYLSKNLINEYSQNTAEIYKDNSKNIRTRQYFSTDPVQVVQNMFNGGRWLNTYELPYFGGSYLKSNHATKWSQNGIKGFLGALGGDGDNIGLKMLGMDFPSNPKFQAEMASTRDPIELEFYLLNVNNEWLKKNFQFLNAIYAGANWLHMKYCIVRPPNVYNVVCPGRFQMYWAAINVTVTFEGKLRRNIKVSQELRSYSKAIDDAMLWPDAWKVKIKIRDLTPNNFNMYAEYYMNGFNAEEVASLEEQQSLSQALSSVVNYFNEVKTTGEKIWGIAEEETGRAKEEMEEIKKKLKNTMKG